MTPTPLNKMLQAISTIGLFGIIILAFVFDSFHIIDLYFFPIFIAAMIIGTIPTALDYKRGKFTFKCSSCKQTYEASIKGKALVHTHSEVTFPEEVAQDSDLPSPSSEVSKLIWIIITILIFGSMASYFTYQFLKQYIN